MLESDLSWVGEQRCSGSSYSRRITSLKSLASLERLFGILGVVFLTLFVGGMTYREVSSRAGLSNFDKNQSENIQAPQQLLGDAAGNKAVDLSLWSRQRIQAYRESLPATRKIPLAVLRLDKFKIRIPVFEGTDELVLNRGAGWIPGTARPGESGNVGIAGHRDGFFRVLKDITLGDAIELSTTRAEGLYTVDQIEIVNPDNVRVLLPRSVPSITLTTCYPFYFAGDAPQRFIVHAALRHEIDIKQSHHGSASARAIQVNNKEKEK